jgi:hypothetical protein
MKKWAKEVNTAFSKKEIQMAKKHMQKCSISLAIKEMQIKITPVRIPIINHTNNKCWQACGEKQRHIHCW